MSFSSIQIEDSFLSALLPGKPGDHGSRLLEAHERFSRLVSKSRYQVVYPVLPMDILGLYILLPALEDSKRLVHDS